MSVNQNSRELHVATFPPTPQSHKKISVGIVGYGRMGKEIAQQALAKDFIIAFIVDPVDEHADAPNLAALETRLQTADVAIEFSLPNVVADNVRLYANAGVSAVIGTTGWEQDSSEVEKIVVKHGIGLVHGGNFSIGAHLLMRIANYTAKLANKVSEYDLSVFEAHHSKKQDSPSGTALMLAHTVLEQLDRKTHVCTTLPASEPIAPMALSVVSQRVGHEVGLHKLILDSAFDTITVAHQARSRAGFALGAVMAAQWLYENEKKGFISVYEFIDDLLEK